MNDEQCATNNVRCAMSDARCATNDARGVTSDFAMCERSFNELNVVLKARSEVRGLETKSRRVLSRTKVLRQEGKVLLLLLCTGESIYYVKIQNI